MCIRDRIPTFVGMTLPCSEVLLSERISKALFCGLPVINESPPTDSGSPVGMPLAIVRNDDGVVDDVKFFGRSASEDHVIH